KVWQAKKQRQPVRPAAGIPKINPRGAVRHVVAQMRSNVTNGCHEISQGHTARRGSRPDKGIAAVTPRGPAG
ncbi:MAG: hypothetical protein IIZ25_08060, partial [Thermoguttaceae bacterium]|nr:hypothetical protein [Thermoguttaceae bacterium]